MKIQSTLFLNRIKRGKRITVAVVGGTVLGAGFALVVLPGPAYSRRSGHLGVGICVGQTLAAQGQRASAGKQLTEETRNAFFFLGEELSPRQGCGLVPQRHSFDSN